MCTRVMESDCRIPMACLRPRILALHALFWGLVSLRVFGAALLSDEKAAVAVTKAVTAPCWQLEEFVVAKECSACEGLQSKTFSCRSTKMEEHLFWKFEGTVLALTVVFAILVVTRQRSLDRQASDKVRRQIESI
ncbi:protein JTB [Cyprinus carpio]|uniref:Protein JTB n=1 Tax=Cyprinus carpio TaxID=7962 RepID=A0A9R0AJT3_CYPCA|nr:protein JTB [Cyprinus carpio]